MIKSIVTSLIASPGRVRYTKWGTHVTRSNSDGALVSELYNNATRRLVRRTHSPNGAFTTEYINMRKGLDSKPEMTSACKKGHNGSYIHRFQNMIGDVLVFFKVGNKNGFKRPFINSRSYQLSNYDEASISGYLNSQRSFPGFVSKSERHAYPRLKDKNYTGESPYPFSAINRLLSRTSSENEIGVMTDSFASLPRIYERVLKYLGK